LIRKRAVHSVRTACIRAGAVPVPTGLPRLEWLLAGGAAEGRATYALSNLAGFAGVWFVALTGSIDTLPPEVALLRALVVRWAFSGQSQNGLLHIELFGEAGVHNAVFDVVVDINTFGLACLCWTTCANCFAGGL